MAILFGYQSELIIGQKMLMIILVVIMTLKILSNWLITIKKILRSFMCKSTCCKKLRSFYTKALQFELTHEKNMPTVQKFPVTLGQEDGEGTIWTHEMVSLYLGGTDHVDPTDYWTETANDYFGTDYDVEDFVELIQAYYNAL